MIDPYQEVTLFATHAQIEPDCVKLTKTSQAWTLHAPHKACMDCATTRQLVGDAARSLAGRMERAGQAVDYIVLTTAPGPIAPFILTIWFQSGDER